VKWRLDPLEYLGRLPGPKLNLLLNPIVIRGEFLDFLIVGLAAFVQVVIFDFVFFQPADGVVVLQQDDFHLLQEPLDYLVDIFEFLLAFGVCP